MDFVLFVTDHKDSANNDVVSFDVTMTYDNDQTLTASGDVTIQRTGSEQPLLQAQLWHDTLPADVTQINPGCVHKSLFFTCKMLRTQLVFERPSSSFLNFKTVSNIMLIRIAYKHGSQQDCSEYVKYILTQECIPVGCVPSAAVAVCWGGGVSGWGCLVGSVRQWVSAWGVSGKRNVLRNGVCPGGSAQGGVCAGGCLPGGGVCPRGMSAQVGVSAWGVSAQGGCLPSLSRGCLLRQGVCPGGVCLVCPGGRHPSLWTESLTHACENITFPQLRLRTVMIGHTVFTAFVYFKTGCQRLSTQQRKKDARILALKNKFIKQIRRHQC